MVYANKPQGVFGLFKNCFTAYPQVLKDIWWLIVISSCVYTLEDTLNNLISPHKAPAGSSLTLVIAISLLASLITMFIYVIMLHLAHTGLSGRKPRLAESLANAKRRYLPFLGGLVFTIFLGALAFLLLSIPGTIGSSSMVKLIAALFYLIGLIVNLFLIFVFYFASTVIVIDQQSIFKSLKTCAKWVWQYKWRIGTASFLVTTAICLIVTPVFYVIIKLPEKYNILTDIILFVLPFFTYPITISPALVLLNDMKLRAAKAIPPENNSQII